MEHFEEFSLKNMQVPEFRDYKMADRKYDVLKNEIVEFQGISATMLMYVFHLPPLGVT